MIVDIPTPADFAESGISFLNLAWDAAIDLVLNLHESEDRDELEDEYWSRAQRPLATAVTLAQQGTEFLLKARIAQVSPFLLLSAQPRDWPKAWEQADCSYAEFRTVDAQDLVKVHDTVSSARLSADFRIEFEKMRRVRNSLVHTIDKAKRFAASEVLKWVLHARTELAPDHSWITYRNQYLEASPGAAFPDYYDCGWGPKLAREFGATMNVLTPSECRHLLGIQDKKQRFYYCLGCHWYKADLSEHAKTAQLNPNTPDGTALYCYVCEESRAVLRKACKECPGNVLDAEDETCLSCGAPCRS